VVAAQPAAPGAPFLVAARAGHDDDDEFALRVPGWRRSSRAPWGYWRVNTAWTVMVLSSDAMRSGVLADLDRAGLVERRPDPADRRRTIVQIIPGQATLIGHWLDGAAKPLTRVLDKLTPDEQEAFLKAMDLLETELHRQDTGS
jgi:hypothetical protein